ncbi:MAG: hypothetical protein AB8B62_02820 [Roseobacter sp.]
MTLIATVNYHVHRPERQAFKLDAGAFKGNHISPELAPMQVDSWDVREDHIRPFNEVSVGFTHFPSKVQSFGADQSW